MDDILVKVSKLFPESTSDLLTKEIPTSIAFLFIEAKSAVGVSDKVQVETALFNIQAVLDFTWERLNVGHWKEVPEHHHQLYTLASLVKILLLLQTCTGENDAEVIRTALCVADVGLIVGAPLNLESHVGDLRQVANILTASLNELYDPLAVIEPLDIVDRKETIHSSFRSEKDNWQDIPTLQCPSLETFSFNHFTPQLPVKLTGCMTHWPAVKLWTNMNYLVERAGARMVPIELGAHYVDPEWSQDLMTLSEFIGKHILGRAENVGYLAQHRLFDQIPELRADIYEPEYCCLGDGNGEETDVNAWFGPKGTVSPLHFDPKNNLLCQVVGSKRVLLYAPDHSRFLYPHEQSPITNTARVDPEQPNLDFFPEFRQARGWECYLNPGEMLYIPPRWWHHVRSLATSFSVSFWWQ